MTLTLIAFWGIAVFSVIGLIFGVALAATARRFHVPSDPLIDEVQGNLPAANCGACGFAGCRAYAEAVVTQRTTSPSLCIPGGQSCANIVAKLTGKFADTIKPMVVVLRCYGTRNLAKTEAEYRGINTCEAAALVFGGPKSCKNGCLGLGDCERICRFDAIHIGKLGIAEVDTPKCTGCGKCVEICPKHTLELLPRNHRVQLACTSRGKPNRVRLVCSVGCITCKKCVKLCPAGAISWDGTILIDHEKCIAYGPSCHEACVEGCPTTIMHRIGQVPSPKQRKEQQPSAS